MSVDIEDATPTGQPVLDRRRAGVLLHPTSLPSGTLGEDALRLLDFLVAGGFSVWQVLPLGSVGENASPYSPDSAFAGNTHLVPQSRRAEEIDPGELQRFRERESGWLEDYAFFTVIREVTQGRPWWEWPPGLRHRDARALQNFAKDHSAQINQCVKAQFRFSRCWRELRSEAGKRGILLYGDLPMFVVGDSADVWAKPEIFQLDRQGRATHVAGVPPDAFTELGQCWDNPVFNWERMQSEGFGWWKQRLAHELERFDLLRWDHFRGLNATWEIPAGEGSEPPNAAAGAWREVPGEELLLRLTAELGSLPLVAENLGIITPEVEALRHRFGLPGMHVLQFAFDGHEDNPHLPDKHEKQGVVYTGTHDNDTSLGWYSGLAQPMQQDVLRILGRTGQSMPDALVQAALDSVCQLAVIPLQDLMRLGSGARMNKPGQAQGQWSWQFTWQQLAAAGFATGADKRAGHWGQVVRESGRT